MDPPTSETGVGEKLEEGANDHHPEDSMVVQSHLVVPFYRGEDGTNSTPGA